MSVEGKLLRLGKAVRSHGKESFSMKFLMIGKIAKGATFSLNGFRPRMIVTKNSMPTSSATTLTPEQPVYQRLIQSLQKDITTEISLITQVCIHLSP